MLAGHFSLVEVKIIRRKLSSLKSRGGAVLRIGRRVRWSCRIWRYEARPRSRRPSSNIVFKTTPQLAFLHARLTMYIEYFAVWATYTLIEQIQS